MKLRSGVHIIKQGFVSIWKNRMMSFASVSSVTAALMILGIVLILILNINNIASITKSQFGEVIVYLENDLEKEEINAIGQTINQTDGVLSSIFQSKEQALVLMEEYLGNETHLLADIEENPFPNSYIIQLKDIKYADDVVNKVTGLIGIDEVRYLKDVLDQLMIITHFVRLGGLIVIGVLIIIAVFIISNTIKITVAARKREINIMKYVGATDGFIRGSFVIEGMLLGLIGAVLSIAAVYYGYKYLFNIIKEELYVLFTIYLIPYSQILNDVVIMFIAIGVGIGVIGSVLSIRKFLRV